MGRPSRAGAADVLDRALGDSIAAQQRVGGYTWIEDCGIAVKLAPAPASTTWPRLLAGDAPEGQGSAALWELGDTGFRGLQQRLESGGATFEASTAFRFRPRAYPAEITGNWTRVTLAGGRAAGVVDFAANDRKFAFVFASATGDERLLARRDTVLHETLIMPGAKAGSAAPLLLEGRYAAVLPGWQRVGDRFYAKVGGGWLGLRMFQVAETDFVSMAGLQTALEGDLLAAGFKPASGNPARVAETSGFLREYSRPDDPYVQRVLYANLAGGYLVALMQAPIALRDHLEAHMAQFVASIARVDLGGMSGVPAPYFNEVRNVRCVAWQSGRQVIWGALFDDARHQPVAWRQDEVAWAITATREGEIVAQKSGATNSSRSLNPLVDADQRALAIPGDWTGPVELELKVGTQTARATVAMR
jgi:hypothetical protein